MVDRDEYLNVVVICGTLRDNATSLGGLVVGVAEKVGVYERIGAVA